MKEFYEQLRGLTLNVTNYVDAMLSRGHVKPEDLVFVAHLRQTSVAIHEESLAKLQQIVANEGEQAAKDPTLGLVGNDILPVKSH